MEPVERGGIRAQVGHVVWAGRNLLGQLAHLVVEGVLEYRRKAILSVASGDSRRAFRDCAAVRYLFVLGAKVAKNG